MEKAESAKLQLPEQSNDLNAVPEKAGSPTYQMYNELKISRGRISFNSCL
jgi:hypothetical protein